jgi:hypothetical protein
MAWRRLSQSAYLAFLTLAPAFAAAAAGDSMPPAGAVLISLASGVMEWIAYAYCVGYLQDQAVR